MARRSQSTIQARIVRTFAVCLVVVVALVTINVVGMQDLLGPAG